MPAAVSAERRRGWPRASVRSKSGARSPRRCSVGEGGCRARGAGAELEGAGSRGRGLLLLLFLLLLDLDREVDGDADGGDQDGDGLPDVLVGSPFSNSQNFANNGQNNNCDAFHPAGSAYTGDCGGRAFLYPSTGLLALKDGGAGEVISCGIGTNGGLRAGAAVGPVGPSPVDGQERWALGGPGLNNTPGQVFVWGGNINRGDPQNPFCDFGDPGIINLQVVGNPTGSLAGSVLAR